jgi:Flp pilus assembly protein TadD
MVNRMREKSSNMGVHTRALVTVTSLALVSGCATNPFENLPNQLSSFFKDSGFFENSTTDYGDHDDEQSLNLTEAEFIEPSSSEMALNKPREKFSDLSRMLEQVAETALSNRNYGAAARIYGRAHDLAPDRTGPALGLARASREIGDHRASLKAYRMVLRHHSEHPAALREISRELMDMGAPRDAIPYLKTASAKDLDPRLGNELGIAHDLIGNHDAAQTEFRAALARSPGDLTLRANLGRSLAFSGRYDEAIITLQAVANSPSASKSHREALAMAHAASGDVSAAVQATGQDVRHGVEANQRARYAMIGELVRSGEPGARAELIAGTVQRDRFSAKIGQAQPNKPKAIASKDSRKPDLLAVLAGIDQRSSGRQTPQSAKYVDELPETAHQSPEIASKAAPKPLYAAPTTLNLAPDLGVTSPEAAPVQKAQFAYHVQLSAYHSKERAEKGWRQLVLKAPDILDDLDHIIVKPDPKFNAGGLLRLRTQACDSRDEANRMCDDLKSRGLGCLVVRSTVTLGPVITKAVRVEEVTVAQR